MRFVAPLLALAFVSAASGCSGSDDSSNGTADSGGDGGVDTSSHDSTTPTDSGTHDDATDAHDATSDGTDAIADAIDAIGDTTSDAIGDAIDGDGADTAPFVPPLEGCTTSGWCWENPLPFGNSLASVWAASSTNVWAVGNELILHYDGTAWSNVGFPPSFDKYHDLHSVWGSGPSDVWAVGSQAGIFHYDGTAWTLAVPGGGDPYVTVAGNGPSDAYVFYSDGSVSHWDGTSWNDTGLTAPYGVTAGAVSGADVWAVGDLTKVHHYDGTTWTTEIPSTTAVMNAVTIASSGEVYVAGDHVVSKRSTGTAGTWGELAGFPGVGRAIYVETSGTVDVVGDGGALYHWSGSSWTTDTVKTDADLLSLSASSSTDAWAVGAYGSMLHWDGTAWSTRPYITRETFTSAWAAPDGTTWAVTRPTAFGKGAPGKLFRDAGKGFAEVTIPAVSELLAISGAGSSFIVAVGPGGTVLTWDGTTFATTVPTTPYASSATLRGVWASGPSDIWIGGDRPGSFEPQGIVLHWDGSTWTESFRRDYGSLHSVWGSSATDVYAVGAIGGLGIPGTPYSLGVHFDGTTWSDIGVPANPETAYGTSKSDVFIGGAGGVWRFDGTSWMTGGWSAGATGLFGVTGDIYAVTGAGEISHWDGSAWTGEDSPAIVPLYGGATAGTVVRAVGAGGAILRKK
jgi:hypothetical protein